MISFKKALLAFGIGIGMAGAAQAWILPDCVTCQTYLADCWDGDRAACDLYDKGRYGITYPTNDCEMYSAA